MEPASSTSTSGSGPARAGRGGGRRVSDRVAYVFRMTVRKVERLSRVARAWKEWDDAQHREVVKEEREDLGWFVTFDGS